MSKEQEIKDEIMDGAELHQELFDGMSTEDMYDLIARALN
jgi:hypothetical protein